MALTVPGTLGAAWGAESASGVPVRTFGAEPPPRELVDASEGYELTRAYLPSAVDLSAMMPPPADQGDVGSCVAHAVGYAVRGYYAALQHGAKPGDRRFTPSVAFLHSQFVGFPSGVTPTEAICRETGSSAHAAIRYMQERGAPTDEAVPSSRICEPDLLGAQARMSEFTVQGKKTIYPPPKGGNRPANDLDINKMKQAIAAGNPVPFGIGLVRGAGGGGPGEALKSLEPNAIYHGSASPNDGPSSSGHEMVAIGYDDDRQAFRVQNSWGTGWGDGGFGWIGYDAMKADLGEALIMDAGIVPPKPKPAEPKRSRPNVAGAGKCAVVSKKANGIGYEGFVQDAAELAALQDEVGAEQTADVAIRPWPVCEAMKTLDVPLLAHSRPEIGLIGGGNAKAFGDVLAFSVTAPTFPSFLYVVYLQADGTVVNLVPRRGLLRAQTPPGTVLVFGDGRDGRQTFRIGPPAGTEAVVAIAARSPLRELEELETEGQSQFRLAAASGDEAKDAADRLYLSRLRSALAEKRDADLPGRTVTADVLHLTVLHVALAGD